MRIGLYILLAIVGLIIIAASFVYFYFVRIPKLELPSNAPKEEIWNTLDQWLNRMHEKGKLNGGILIAKDQQALFMKTYGYTDWEKTTPLNAQSSFRLASVSKQFTAAGIMLLRENGLLAFDDLLTKHIKGFPYSDVTIRHLLTHTSGIPDVYMDLAEKNKDRIGDVLSIQEVVDLVVSNPTTPNAKPLEQYAYSNTGYVLLAGIIEIISQQSFEDFMRLELFEPLGMKNTRVWNLLSEDTTFENKTSSFNAFWKKPLQPGFIDGVAGDGAVFSSLEDFLIWDQFWYSNNLISAATLQEAFKAPTLANGKTSNYGFGWILQGDVVWHNGGWLGARTFFSRNTKNKTCLVLLDNSANASSGAILKELSKLSKVLNK